MNFFDCFIEGWSLTKIGLTQITKHLAVIDLSSHECKFTF